MPQITITIDDEAKKIISKRAKRNLFTLREQIEDIIRKSAIRSKNAKKSQSIKIDDKLVSIFSTNKRTSSSKKKKRRKKA